MHYFFNSDEVNGFIYLTCRRICVRWVLDASRKIWLVISATWKKCPVQRSGKYNAFATQQRQKLILTTIMGINS